MSNKHYVHYGFGKEYLSNWGINEALREIYQNYIDFGEYKVKAKVYHRDKDKILVTITNEYTPEKLEFLRIGNSEKNGNINAIGKHGEGLKMAFLIFLREGLDIKIFTDKYVIYPIYKHSILVGDTFSICFQEHGIKDKKFTTEFICPTVQFTNFNNSVIKDDDVIHKVSYHGEIVNRTNGDIYSGKLFVCHLDNISRSYNLNPSVLSLDRDRCLPKTWDINYHTSKINEDYERWNTKDLSFSDTLYISNVPNHIKSCIKPVIAGNNIEFQAIDDEGNTSIIKNDSVKQALVEDSYFKRAIDTLKKFIARKLGLYELLIEFQNKHITTEEARQDFAIILDRVKPT